MARNYFIYIALFLTVLITVGSLISLRNVSVVHVSNSDKFVHVVAYFLLTVSWLLSAGNKIKYLWHVIAIVFLVFVYGIIIEVLQGAITNVRQADIYDVLANSTGILAALIIFLKVLQKKINEINNIIAKVVLKLLN